MAKIKIGKNVYEFERRGGKLWIEGLPLMQFLDTFTEEELVRIQEEGVAEIVE